MSRTMSRPRHTRYFTPTRTRNLLRATAREVIRDYTLYGNRVPLFDGRYDDVIPDADAQRRTLTREEDA